jgi:hypothetical protein
MNVRRLVGAGRGWRCRVANAASAALALFVTMACAAAPAHAQQLVPGSMDVRWNPGAADCKTDTQPPLQVHQYEARTFILRKIYASAPREISFSC